MAKCKIGGCDNCVWAKSVARGLCLRHHKKWQRYGSPTGGAKYEKGERFRWLESNASHSGDDCLIWPYAIQPSGYGAMQVEYKTTSPHRWMCEKVYGPPPSGRHQAAHSCNNRSCVNPAHLRWATPLENIADRVMHGTQLFGENSPSHKLTAADVTKIRELRKAMILADIAKQFGISIGATSRICRGESWAWLQQT